MKPKKLLNLKDCARCRQCCKFQKKDAAWAPVFSSSEIDLILKKNKTKNKVVWVRYKKTLNTFQPRLVKSEKLKNIYVCPFLNEKKYQCFIEKLKPFDCLIWPFVLMKNKRKDAINLVYYSRKYCLGLEGIRKGRIETYKRHLINFCKLNSIVPYLGALWDYDADAVRVCEIMKIPSGHIF